MGTIRITAKFFILQFFLFFFPAYAQVDGGEAIKIGWGTKDVEVAAGTHQVTVYIPYLFGLIPRMGENQIEVSVAEGETVAVKFRAPFLVFMKGKLTVA
jgi:hypothetical protein